MFPSSEKRFLICNRFTIISLFLVILAGGVVRATGSGMGCPDWPKCFDRIIPPTKVSQLPADYKDKYVQKRMVKNERFAKALNALGYDLLATAILKDKSIREPEEFNAAKTWTEYINRLVGAVTGLLMLGCVVFSLIYLKSQKRIFFFSFINLILIGFQAWLGSIVVSTNLLAWMVTAHMVLALVIVAISIYTYFMANFLRHRNALPDGPTGLVRFFALIVLVLTVIQVVLGTEVRERIDAISSLMDHLNRSEWVGKVGSLFIVHREMALLVSGVNLILFFLIRSRYPLSSYQFRYISYVMVLLVIQVLTGVVLSYFALPGIAQAAHISLSSLLFGAQFYVFLMVQSNRLNKIMI